jgi:hypothetical protein
MVKDLTGTWTYSTNCGDQIHFIWNKGRHQANTPLSCCATNVGILRSAPGHQVFLCFVEEASPLKTFLAPNFFACQVITSGGGDNTEQEEDNTSLSNRNSSGGSVHPTTNPDLIPDTVHPPTNPDAIHLPTNLDTIPYDVHPSPDLHNSAEPNGTSHF